ncbi:MAG TPA: hypothetical protein PLR99_15630 [Polyangiaceae bacterium]|nr:hypothetical protein [Polyangiaceae bacterium]
MPTGTFFSVKVPFDWLRAVTMGLPEATAPHWSQVTPLVNSFGVLLGT